MTLLTSPLAAEYIGVESEHVRYISGQIHLLFMLGERDLDNTDDAVLVYPIGKFI